MRRQTYGLCMMIGLVLTAPAGAQQVGTTLEDFFRPGSQPDPNYNEEGLPQALLGTGEGCAFCHSAPDFPAEPTYPLNRWNASMHAQAVRDPMFHAAMTVAEQDAAFAGELCLRCHAPKAWLEGRGDPTDGSALNENGLFPYDFEGVTCIICHRMVDPVYEAGVNPVEDLEALVPEDLGGVIPTEPFNASYIIDPVDRRRGPFDLTLPGLHAWLQSPFHNEALLCAHCHDVGNPMYMRQGGATPAASDTYTLVADDAPHPTQNRYDLFPTERTYSEWSQSAFALGPVETDGRFGGNITAVSACQDCHMPDASGMACFFQTEERDDAPEHNFNGANSWIIQAVLEMDDDLPGLAADLHPNYVPSDLTQLEADEAVGRAQDMAERASDMELSVANDVLTARVTNRIPHKLPTGYPEGRRMWLNVQFRDAGGLLLTEHGAYDPATAVLTTGDTKVYEVKLGMDATVAAATGNSPGESFHFVLNNVVVQDNRIPPAGFNNANFEAVQASPVGVTYGDGQNWDDSDFTFPCDAVSAEVRLYYQTTSKEYVEFLRDENTTDAKGQLAYDLWVMTGKSTPVEMDLGVINLGDYNDNGVADFCDRLTYGDVDDNLSVDADDLICMVDGLSGGASCLGVTDADLDIHPCDVGDSDLNLKDLLNLLDALAGSPPCPAPAEFTRADQIRGGKMYDKWWAEAGVNAPVADHPFWSMQSTNTRSGADTWRCKECHGWDYKGAAGVYGSGSHFTGFAGIFGTAMGPQEVFNLLKFDHSFEDLTDLTDEDIWDLVKFVLQGQIDTDDIIDGAGAFIGDEMNGMTLFEEGITSNVACTVCHGADGLKIEFHGGEFLGSVANENPWEVQHKIRYGNPAVTMPSAVRVGAPNSIVGDVGKYAQTLPQ